MEDRPLDPPSSLPTGLIEADFMVWTEIRESSVSVSVIKEERSGFYSLI